MKDELEVAVQESVEVLRSSASRAALLLDPYWPKWDGPWWRATLLWELGRADAIPRDFADALCAAVDRHYLHDFPLRLEDVPPGRDPVRDVMCHCGLGTVVQVLAACGVDALARLPWVLPWCLRYQLPDGGLNCDEAAYTRPTPRGSVVSTLPLLEAVLRLAPRSPEGDAFLDRGAEYLLARRLWRSLSRGGVPIHEGWLRPSFPRFYHYDVLRGLRFLVGWAEARGRRLPEAAVGEARDAIDAARDGAGQLRAGRRPCDGARTRVLTAQDAWEPAATFPLLELVSRTDAPSPWLTREWDDVRARLARVVEAPPRG
jgi:hypothetical protein